VCVKIIQPIFKYLLLPVIEPVQMNFEKKMCVILRKKVCNCIHMQNLRRYVILQQARTSYL